MVEVRDLHMHFGAVTAPKCMCRSRTSTVELSSRMRVLRCASRVVVEIVRERRVSLQWISGQLGRPAAAARS